MTDKKIREELIFCQLWTFFSCLSMPGMHSYLLGGGVEEGHFINDISWPLIELRKISTVGSRVQSWTVKISD
jgi:hypothetical protein